MKRFFVTCLGSFFYTGFLPFAPASAASLVWLALYLFLPGGHWLVHPYSLIITVPLATYLSGEMEKRYGKDAHCIVIDEFVGMQVSLLAVTPGLLTGIIGFVLFRIFDILKPFPVGASQRIRGGFGVVADDILAGVYARILLLLIIHFFNLA